MFIENLLCDRDLLDTAPPPLYYTGKDREKQVNEILKNFGKYSEGNRHMISQGGTSSLIG